MSSKENKFERLPDTVVPVFYHVSLQPDLKALTFEGWEKICIKVKTATDIIILNVFDIIVTEALLIADDVQQSPEVFYSVDEERLEFRFQEEILPGNYELNLRFSGQLNDQFRGFYRNKSHGTGGSIEYGAGTHFEATGARRAYPCWDEPAIKARFKFTLIVPRGKVALSNMPVESEDICPNNNDLKRVTFQLTPLMSTYLTAFVVGDYDWVEDAEANETPIRVFTPPGYKEHGRFALEVATKALSFYQSYFNIPYGLPKLDLITLSELPIGAMENWGLVTFTESALLMNPSNSSAFRKQEITITVTHELSHNWFGNLVTMEWWTDLWLKEGFASWISYLCTDALFPEFSIWKQFIASDQSNALKKDALSNTHPVEVAVHRPGEIDEIFDFISYYKGACLIQMLQSHIGHQVFRNGMILYLQRHQFSNTVTKDMWEAMSKASGLDIGSMMNTWTKQKGFPLIKVEESSPQVHSDRRIITITQEKFLSGSLDTEVNEQSWIVPFSITTATSPSTPAVSGVLKGRSLEVEIPNCGPEDWIFVNSGQFMFYHVQYGLDLLRRLSSAVQPLAFSPEDRLGLIRDLFALSLAGYISIVEALKLSEEYLSWETDYAVCSKLLSELCNLQPLIQHLASGAEAQFKKFMCKNLQNMANLYGWDAKPGEDHTTKLIRGQVLSVLGISGHHDTVLEASKRFSDYYSGHSELSADIKTSVFLTVLGNGDKEIFSRLLQLYDAADTLEEKNRISKTLGATADESLIAQTLAFALSDKVRNQDTIFVLAGATRTLKGREMVWKFVQDNWSELYRRYCSSTMMTRFIQAITDGVCCIEKAKEIQEFFKVNKAKNAQRAIQQGLEDIQSRATFIQQQGSALMEFLQPNSLL